jgi:hypothetical protein
MNIIIVLTTIGALAYLLYAYYQQNEADSNREYKISIATTAYSEAKKETETAKQDLIKFIAGIYGQADADRVSTGKIWIGMNSDLLIASWGRAGDINDSYVRGVRIEKWYYNPYYNRLNNLKYKFEITVENNEIKGWKDLV